MNSYRLNKNNQLPKLKSHHRHFFSILIIIPLIIVLIPIITYKCLPQEKYQLVKIQFNSNYAKEDFLKSGLFQECGNHKFTEYHEIILSESEIKFLKDKGLIVEILQDDYEMFLEKELAKSNDDIKKSQLSEFILTPGSMGGYYTLDEIYDEFEKLKTKYKDYIKLTVIIGYSFEQKPIYAYNITKNNIGQKTEILFTSLHHAREPGSVVQLIYFLNHILENASNGDIEAEYLLSRNSLWVVPVVNPDGYYYNQKSRPNGGGLWRKNRKKFNDSTFGVDLNRNYGPYEYWNSPNLGSTTDPKYDTYRGTDPFSEPETQAIRDFCYLHNFKTAMNFHTYYNVVLYPYSWSSTECPDSIFFRESSKILTDKNKFCFGRDEFTVGYGARGTSDDWMYSIENNKPRIFALTPEIGKVSEGFWNPFSNMLKICSDNLRMIYEFIWSSRFNIKPIQLILESIQIKPEKQLNLKIINAGIADFNGKVKIILKSLDNSVSVLDSLVVDGIKSTEINELMFKPGILSKSFINGSYIPFQIEISYENISRLDTFQVQYFEHSELNLFSKGNLNGSWDKGFWGLQYDSVLGEFVLADSPKGNYRDSLNNYLTLTEPIKLDGLAATLEFTTKWSLEPTFDFYTIEISTNNGLNWEYLETSRMVEGDSVRGGKQMKNSVGFHGTYPDWIKQECSLNKYINRDILLRFGLLSDKGKNFDGCFLTDIKIRIYNELSKIEDNDFKTEIIPSNFFTAKGNDIVLKEPICNLKEYRISNSIGQELIYEKSSDNNECVDIINTKLLNQGVYFFSVHTTRQILYGKILVY